MEKENILTRAEINSVTKTNFERILRPHYLPFLKINRNKNYWISPSDIEIFKVRMRAVQKNLSGKNVGGRYMIMLKPLPFMIRYLLSYMVNLVKL